MKLKIFSLTILLAVIFIFSSNISLGSSYDIYVDNNYSEDDSDGSSEKPYAKISKAIEKSGSGGKRIYISNGTYNENLILNKGVELYGQDRNKTIIKNSGNGIIAKGENEIKNLTIIGGSSAITFEGKGEMDKCNIKNASRIGINLTPKSDEFKLKNSKISSNSKGLFIQMRRKVEIMNNEFTNNREEGVDIRNKTTGVVKSNIIENNSESGIEIILGSSNISIVDNSIKNNRASGIATQFYPDFDKSGKITIERNVINKNGNYGIDCRIPQGGKPTADYWSSSVSLNGNTIEDNKQGSIQNLCRISQLSEKNDQSEEIIKKEEAPTEEELKINKRMDEIFLRQAFLNETILYFKNQLAKSNETRFFLIEKDYENLKKIILNIENLQQAQFQLEEINKELEISKNTIKIQQNTNIINQTSLRIGEYQTLVSSITSPIDKLLSYPLIDHYLLFPNSFQYN